MKKELYSWNPIFNGFSVWKHGLPHTCFFSDCKELQPLHTTVNLTRKYKAVVEPKGKPQTASLFRFSREVMGWLNFNQSYVNQRDFFNLPSHEIGCKTCSSLALGNFSNLDPRNSRSCLQRFISIPSTENSCHKVPAVYLNRPVEVFRMYTGAFYSLPEVRQILNTLTYPFGLLKTLSAVQMEDVPSSVYC